MVQSRVQYGPRWERIDALLPQSQQGQSRIASPNPIARFIKHVKLRLSQRYIESNIAGHGRSLRMLVLRRSSSIRVAPSHPSSARAITAMFCYLGLQITALIACDELPDGRS
jgi:hypothetical protein